MWKWDKESNEVSEMKKDRGKRDGKGGNGIDKVENDIGYWIGS